MHDLSAEQTAEAFRVSKAIQPALCGLDDAVQGAVIADLLSLWLAGHFVWGNEEATHELRQELLRMHIQAVIDLVPESAKEIANRFPTAGNA